MTKQIEFDIFYNRDNDHPWAIRVRGKRKWVLADIVDFYNISLISKTSKKQPKAFLTGRGRLIKVKSSSLIRYIVQGE